jgi:hypothetical protein
MHEPPGVRQVDRDLRARSAAGAALRSASTRGHVFLCSERGTEYILSPGSRPAVQGGRVAVAMARNYHVEGTRSFLIACVVLAAIGLWSVKDGWFPSPEMVRHQVFNKSLAILCFIGAAICGYIHKVVK